MEELWFYCSSEVGERAANAHWVTASRNMVELVVNTNPPHIYLSDFRIGLDGLDENYLLGLASI